MSHRTSTVRARVWRFERGAAQARSDRLAGEEPLEIRVLAGRERATVAVTMRTPGADFELAAGFLYAEGVVRDRDDIDGISYCVDRALGEEQRYNIVNVRLRRDRLPDLGSLERHFYTSSACGVCGKASLEALRQRDGPALPAGPAVSPEALYRLPEALLTDQGLFAATGGLHAAALFDASGGGADLPLLALREDVGRHNALDKLVGWALLAGRLPLHGSLALLSGRASFELLQKSVAAGIPIVCAISAPSSLAVDVARQFGVTLVGFLRGERFNVYAGVERVRQGERA